MRRTIYSLLMLLSVVFTACHKDILNDIDGLKGDVADLQTRVEALEAQCKQMNTNIGALQTIVNAMQQNDAVTSVVAITNASDTTGYNITFVSGTNITIYNGTKGNDGTAPTVGVRQDTDGIYYWTLNGEFLKDAEGNPLPVTGADGADGVVPLLMIDDDGDWCISYNGGADWEKIGQATGDKGELADTLIQNIAYTDTKITFTLSDQTVLTLPRTDIEQYFILTYCANDGTTTTITDTVWSQKLLSVKTCIFKRNGFKFLEWNTNADGSGYAVVAGDKLQLTHNDTLYARWIDARFSVASGKKVLFAPGNLQYQASTNTWRFAEHQYDYIGDANSNISSTYAGWIDLFGWGTATNPTNTSILESDYTFTDQGTNVIGDYPTNTWRTLSKGEWEYIIKTRTNASSLFGFAKVNGINGVILLPDSLTTLSGITFNAGAAKFSNNEYTTKQWQQMEDLGAVFLPVAGNRYGTEVYNVQSQGYYESNTEYNSLYASQLFFSENWVTCSACSKCTARSVRLAQDF